MKSASRLFYLSLFALWGSPATCAENNCQNLIGDTCASYETLDRLNEKVKPAIDDLVRSTDFFSHYRLNLFNKVCPFWDEENGFCANIGCAVETLDNEDDVPMVWRARELGKLEGPMASHPGRSYERAHPNRPLQGGLGDNVGESCVFEYDDECDERDYCVPEDEREGSKGDYVSLVRNKERFTGYGGEAAWQVWDAIYRENCFQKSSFSHSANLGMSSMPPRGRAVQDFKNVLDAAVPGNANLETEGECLEKRVFYRVISGMHASISAHLCWDFLNQSTGQWQPNVACYESRLHNHPDRTSNLYFNFALVTRAIAKLGPHLRGPHYTFCTGDASEDAATRAKVLEVTDGMAGTPQLFDESLMFVNGEGPSLKEDFRNRFRNISRLMDCVGCDKCRLWGKVQINGYGTALKVLFETDNDGGGGDVPALKRTEVVALFNTYARLSESLDAIKRFRVLLGEAVEPAPAPAPPRQPELDASEALLREFILLERRGPRGESFRDHFGFEIDRFTMAVRIIVLKWMAVPKAVWSVAWGETVRLWQFWVGLPVTPRSWKIALPDLNREEL